MFKSSRSYSGISTVAFAVAAALQAAQGLAQDATEPKDIEEVMVTGSRIAREVLQTPTPVRAMSTEELTSAEPSSLAEAVNLMPEFQNSPRPQTTGISTVGNAGQSFLNLRSIGAQRTLILLDGRRVVASTGEGTVDISVLPETLVRRVEVATGGASAAYGSDAVAGVVNFLLDTDYTGAELQLQGGISEKSDNENMRLGFKGGMRLFDGRAHLLGAISYYDNQGIDSYMSRDWFRSCARIANPAGPPSFVNRCDVVSSHFTGGGLISTGPLRGTQFGPGGVPEPFTFGTFVTQQSMIGGSGVDHGATFQPIPQNDRLTGFARFNYELTPSTSVYLEGLGAEANSHYDSTATWQGIGTAYTIYRNNAFLPAQTAAAMDAAGVTSFQMARYNYDFGMLDVRSQNRTWRAVAGVDSKLGDWKLGAYYEHGENKYNQTVGDNLRLNRLYNAADAVRSPSGEIVCNSTLTQPGNGCVPLNLFGEGAPSQAALDWVQGTTVQDTLVQQDVLEVSVNGEPFDTWAGAVGTAFGVGYRREGYDQTSDPVSQEVRANTGGYRGFPASYANDLTYQQIGGWERTNPLPATGSYDVKEAFGEVIVPLSKNLPFAHSLELNGAARYTDYSTIGGVTTWKVGATYEPFADLMLRAGRSRDIRAANLAELYRGGVQGLSTVNDPTFPVGDPRNAPFVLGRSGGNPNLDPEKANTLTLGAVYEPSWLQGAALAIDYYSIEMTDAIQVLSAQLMIDQCAAGASFTCQFLFRDANGVLTRVERPSLNVGRVNTSGYDFELRYFAPISNLVSTWRGDITFRAIANHIEKLTTLSPGARPVELAGQLSGSGVPDWTLNLSLNYKLDDFSIYLQERYIAGGALDRTLTTAQLSPSDNHVDSVWYTTLSGRYDMALGNSKLELNASINNLFDQDPPSAPGTFFFYGTSATSNSQYDIIGRRYTLGATLKF